MRDTQRERGRDIGRGRSRLRAPGARHGTRSQDPRIASWSKGRRQTRDRSPTTTFLIRNLSSTGYVNPEMFGDACACRFFPLLGLCSKPKRSLSLLFVREPERRGIGRSRCVYGETCRIAVLKVENLQPEIKNIARHLNQEVAVRANQLKWSKRVARLTYLKNMRRLVSELYVRDNCHPFKATILVWIQFPMWIFMSVALRNFSTGAAHSEGFSVQEQLATDGILWFPDLTALDSTWILPISVGVINLLIVEIFALQKIGMSRFQTYITYFVRAVSVLMIPVAATVPSSIVLYWLCSSLMGLSQNLLLRSPRFRQLCRIPLTKSDSDSPYKDLFAAFYTKFISRK
uniref:Cytochrome c oxidase assembly factor COX18 n=1 Tax=Canis lupus dingo TaxID=286419 RepID=A0A8C0LTA9_CANLU